MAVTKKRGKAKRCTHAWTVGNDCAWIVMGSTSYATEIDRHCAKCGQTKTDRPTQAEYREYVMKHRCYDCGAVHEEDGLGACLRALRSEIDKLKSQLRLQEDEP